jgi:hypothetical protein
VLGYLSGTLVMNSGPGNCGVLLLITLIYALHMNIHRLYKKSQVLEICTSSYKTRSIAYPYMTHPFWSRVFCSANTAMV